MKKGRKILSAWVCIVLGMAVALIIQKQTALGTAAFVVLALQILIALISVYLVRSEPNPKNKFLFYNFAVFFFLSTLAFVSLILEPVLAAADGYLPFVVAQYNKGIYYAVLAYAIVYLVLDSLFRDLKVVYKYLGTTAIIGVFFVSYFHDFMIDPKYGYSTADIQDFRSVNKTYAVLLREKGTEPTPKDIAKNLLLPAWQENRQVGTLYTENNLQRVKEIFAYLPGENYNILLYKPIHLYVIKMNVLACFFIMLFFGYQYKKDPPQGAYVEKIMFLMLLFCSMEIFHAWSFIHTVEWEDLLEIFVIGQYISIFILILVAGFFGLRLRFVTSVAGEFYENELVHSAQHITRWRDWLDNLVLYYFFNPKAIRGIFFSQRTKE